mmetsp:Transcript_7980/g.11651  ORF Transcript_7980/g.11651 Transcript_7980/m.11651 type:complete len:81 (+) Transcript_7980:1118-1360(+)
MRRQQHDGRTRVGAASHLTAWCRFTVRHDVINADAFQQTPIWRAPSSSQSSSSSPSGSSLGNSNDEPNVFSTRTRVLLIC